MPWWFYFTWVKYAPLSIGRGRNWRMTSRKTRERSFSIIVNTQSGGIHPVLERQEKIVTRILGWQVWREETRKSARTHEREAGKWSRAQRVKGCLLGSSGCVWMNGGRRGRGKGTRKFQGLRVQVKSVASGAVENRTGENVGRRGCIKNRGGGSHSAGKPPEKVLVTGGER